MLKKEKKNRLCLENKMERPSRRVLEMEPGKNRFPAAGNLSLTERL